MTITINFRHWLLLLFQKKFAKLVSMKMALVWQQLGGCKTMSTCIEVLLLYSVYNVLIP